MNEETNPTEKNNTISIPKYQLEYLAHSLSQCTDWGLTQLKVKSLWKKSMGEGITIAVLDTGCPAKKNSDGTISVHPDLVGNILIDKCKTFVPDEDIYDYNGHGTATAGVISAEDNLLGFVGYAPCAKIITYKVLRKSGSGEIRYIERALRDCVAIKPDIVSMSLGSQYGTDEMHRLVRQLDSMGIPVVCAAGNGGAREGVNYPAKYNESFSIGAYNQNMQIANFSAIGDQIDFAFPGVNIQTTWLNGAYTVISGTSFACPACSGLMALILGYRKRTNTLPDAKNTLWLYNELKKTAQNPKKKMSKTKDWGWGYIDVMKLFEGSDTSHTASFDTAFKLDLSGKSTLNSFSDEELKEIRESIFVSKATDCFLSSLSFDFKNISAAMLVFAAELRIVPFDHAWKDLTENLIKIVKEDYGWYNPARYYYMIAVRNRWNSQKDSLASLWEKCQQDRPADSN